MGWWWHGCGRGYVAIVMTSLDPSRGTRDDWWTGDLWIERRWRRRKWRTGQRQVERHVVRLHGCVLWWRSSGVGHRLTRMWRWGRRGRREEGQAVAMVTLQCCQVVPMFTIDVQVVFYVWDLPESGQKRNHVKYKRTEFLNKRTWNKLLFLNHFFMYFIYKIVSFL